MRYFGQLRVFLILVLCLGPIAKSIAENLYITNLQRVTLRSGPSTDNKIINMVFSGDKLQLIKRGPEWSQVKANSTGQIGWVLNRFLTQEVPKEIILQRVTKRRDILAESNKKLKAELKETKEKLALTQTTLTEKEKLLSESQTKYAELEKGSAQYLTLKENFEKSSALLGKMGAQNQKLKSEMNQKYIYWFLGGAGVLLIGFLIGMTSRKKRYASLSY
jgi:SH3 domain protein